MVSLVLALATIAGSLFWTDDAFPIAPFRMFSYGNRPDTLVRDTRIEGELETGEEIRVGWADVGLRRAELEGQYSRFRADPRLLGSLARAFEDRGVYLDELQLVQRVRHLENRERVGPTETVVLETWKRP